MSSRVVYLYVCGAHTYLHTCTHICIDTCSTHEADDERQDDDTYICVCTYVYICMSCRLCDGLNDTYTHTGVHTYRHTYGTHKDADDLEDDELLLVW